MTQKDNFIIGSFFNRWDETRNQHTTNKSSNPNNDAQAQRLDKEYY